MNRTLTLGLILGLVTSTGFASDEPDSEAFLNPVEQSIEVRITLPDGDYEFTVTGNCAVGNQAINAEGYSQEDPGFNVVKDVYSGLVVFVTDNENEWEIMLDPPDDTSELEGNRFRFEGDVPRNYEESDTDPMTIEVVCTAS